MHPIVNIAIEAARNAGKLMLRSLDRLDTVKINEKTKNDFVTEIDLKAEAIIIDEIKRKYPDHGIIAEESGETSGDETVWIIDPLDGTANFMHGVPHFSISIGVQHKGRMEHGVIYDPIKQELFTATRGQGAQLDGKRIRVSDTHKLKSAFLACGFPFRHPEYIDEFMVTFKKIMQNSSGMRRAGSASLDLAYVACGRFDGYWENNLHAWDLAAGSLLVKEAGGMVCDYKGGEKYLNNGEVVAGNLKIIKSLLPLLS